MFQAILVLLVLQSAPMNGNLGPYLPTKCDVSYKRSCHQYRAVGDHKMICGNRKQHTYCQQTCNGANCRLHCNALTKCQQQCAAGRCDVMVCAARDCNQTCIRGGCEMDCRGNECRQHCYMGGCNMKCAQSVKKCSQSCEIGKCNMHCPAGVQQCEQTCNGGKCNMICTSKECKRSCDGGQCSYSRKVTRESDVELTQRYCDHSDHADNCLQTCVEGNCWLRYKYTSHSSMVQLCPGGHCEFDCKAPLKCTQICTGGRCRKYICNSKFCIQECVAGGCQMECEAETCIQMCRGGNCKMICYSNVDDCFQWCAGGDCIFQCSAKHCNPFCDSLKCITAGGMPKLQAISRKVRCAMITRSCDQVCPAQRSCAFIGWTYLDVFHSANQVCPSGDCRRMLCHISGSCNQTCIDGACGLMVCRSSTCFQDCTGANCDMNCHAKSCTQLCRGGGCTMTCREGTEHCVQLCNAEISRCQLICLAKSCSVSLP